MRFFSNEAQDNVDDKKDRHDDPDTTAPVPQQRAGSPWQHDTDPAPQPVAVGTSTVGDADRTVAFSDGVTRDRDDTEPAPKHTLPDETTPRHELPDTDDKIKNNDTGEGVRSDDATVDAALDDRGTFDDPQLKETDPELKETDADRTDSEADRTDSEAGRTDSEAGRTDSEADRTDSEADRTDPAPERTDAELEWTEAERNAVAAPDPTPEPESTPEPVTARVAGTPAESGPLPFFPAADTQPLRDRWRDVQLRFVDDPKGATADAAGLVDEAVDKLTHALREHRGSFAKGSDDTESLRVELRSYRDILDRLLGL